jgi:uncharacterized protein involved in response to NO
MIDVRGPLFRRRIHPLGPALALGLLSLPRHHDWYRFLTSAVAGLVTVSVLSAAWRYFTTDPKTLGTQPIISMIAPVVGVVLFGLIGGLIGVFKAVRVEKTSVPRDEISQIQFSEISQWMKNDK